MGDLEMSALSALLGRRPPVQRPERHEGLRESSAVWAELARGTAASAYLAFSWPECRGWVGGGQGRGGWERRRKDGMEAADVLCGCAGVA
jgi:hypothetical protein